jgi:carboxyl-terminal processing protease
MTNIPEEQKIASLSPREKISLWLPLIVGLSIAVGLWIGFELHKRSRPATSYVLREDGQVLMPANDKIGEILQLINARYMEAADIAKLEDAAIEGLLQKLDPHSSYIPLAEVQGVNESLTGSFEGIGVEFYLLEDTVLVVGVTEGGPSDTAGLQKGDKIIYVEDSLISKKGITNRQVIEKLKGEANSQVKVKIARQGEKGLKSVTITRGQIPIRSVEVAYMLDAKTGFIKINRFSDKTYKEFMEAVEDLIENNKMQHLVIDLRQNPGGYLTASTEILTQLFDSKKLLVYTQGRSYKRKEYNSTGKPFFKIAKLAVLIDEGSASASEIVAGAIQDNDRGIIVGRRSFGKGLVQEPYYLTDSSVLRLTVARYYTPSGRLIQRPYEKGDLEDYEDDLQKRYLAGELYSKDSIKITDTVKYYTTGGRVVYGGGGIMPDVFVPLDTLMRNLYYNQLAATAAPFVYKMLEIQREKWKQAYPTYEVFQANFNLAPNTFDDFIKYTESKGLTRNELIISSAQTPLLLLIRAYIAQQLFGDDGFFRTMHQQDKIVKKALQEISN